MYVVSLLVAEKRCVIILSSNSITYICTCNKTGNCHLMAVINLQKIPRIKLKSSFIAHKLLN